LGIGGGIFLWGGRGGLFPIFLGVFPQKRGGGLKLLGLLKVKKPELLPNKRAQPKKEGGYYGPV